MCALKLMSLCSEYMKPHGTTCFLLSSQVVGTRFDIAQMTEVFGHGLVSCCSQMVSMRFC